MKIGINLNGVSYHDGTSYRKRDYSDSIVNLKEKIVNPLIEKGHEVSFYVFTYDTVKSKDVERDYNPTKSTYIPESSNFNNATSGDEVTNGWKMMTLTTVNSLRELHDEDLDLVISTRFDINFQMNPFEVYDYDFTKCSFLWREPEFTDLPIVNDNFIVFPYHMLDNMIESLIEQEKNPPAGVNIGNHNIYLPMVNQVGEDKVQWVDDKFRTAIENELYILTRKE